MNDFYPGEGYYLKMYNSKTNIFMGNWFFIYSSISGVIRNILVSQRGSKILYEMKDDWSFCSKNGTTFYQLYKTTIGFEDEKINPENLVNTLNI